MKPASLGTPVWSHDGIVCTGELYKQVVKLTFARGASIEDPTKLFNSSLEGNARRAIDLREGEKINEPAFKQLIRAAVAANSAARARGAAKKQGPGCRERSIFGLELPVANILVFWAARRRPIICPVARRPRPLPSESRRTAPSTRPATRPRHV